MYLQVQCCWLPKSLLFKTVVHILIKNMLYSFLVFFIFIVIILHLSNTLRKLVHIRCEFGYRVHKEGKNFIDVLCKYKGHRPLLFNLFSLVCGLSYTPYPMNMSFYPSFTINYIQMDFSLQDINTSNTLLKKCGSPKNWLSICFTLYIWILEYWIYTSFLWFQCF